MIDTFDAFYEISSWSERGWPILFGRERMHFHKCSERCALVRMDILGEVDDKVGELVCDFDPFYSGVENVGGLLLLAIEPTKERLESFHPKAVEKVLGDLAEGLSIEEVIEKRAALLTKEFLGFTVEDVSGVRPEWFLVPEGAESGEFQEGRLL